MFRYLTSKFARRGKKVDKTNLVNAVLLLGNTSAKPRCPDKVIENLLKCFQDSGVIVSLDLDHHYKKNRDGNIAGDVIPIKISPDQQNVTDQLNKILNPNTKIYDCIEMSPDFNHLQFDSTIYCFRIPTCVLTSSAEVSRHFRASDAILSKLKDTCNYINTEQDLLMSYDPWTTIPNYHLEVVSPSFLVNDFEEILIRAKCTQGLQRRELKRIFCAALIATHHDLQLRKMKRINRGLKLDSDLFSELYFLDQVQYETYNKTIVGNTKYRPIDWSSVQDVKDEFTRNFIIPTDSSYSIAHNLRQFLQWEPDNLLMNIRNKKINKTFKSNEIHEETDGQSKEDKEIAVTTLISTTPKTAALKHCPSKIITKSTVVDIEHDLSKKSADVDVEHDLSKKSTDMYVELDLSKKSADVDVEHDLSKRSTDMDVEHDLSKKSTVVDKEHDLSKKSADVDVEHDLFKKSTDRDVEDDLSKKITDVDVELDLSMKSTGVNVEHDLSKKSTDVDVEHDLSKKSTDVDVEHDLSKKSTVVSENKSTEPYTKRSNEFSETFITMSTFHDEFLKLVSNLLDDLNKYLACVDIEHHDGKVVQKEMRKVYDLMMEYPDLVDKFWQFDQTLDQIEMINEFITVLCDEILPAIGRKGLIDDLMVFLGRDDNITLKNELILKLKDIKMKLAKGTKKTKSLKSVQLNAIESITTISFNAEKERQTSLESDKSDSGDFSKEMNVNTKALHNAASLSVENDEAVMSENENITQPFIEESGNSAQHVIDMNEQQETMVNDEDFSPSIFVESKLQSAGQFHNNTTKAIVTDEDNSDEILQRAFNEKIFFASEKNKSGFQITKVKQDYPKEHKKGSKKDTKKNNPKEHKKSSEKDTQKKNNIKTKKRTPKCVQEVGKGALKVSSKKLSNETTSQNKKKTLPKLDDLW